VRLVSGLVAATGKELAVRAVFEHPTVAGLARALESVDGATMRYEPFLDFSLANPASLKSQPPHPELYCVHPAAGGSVCYSALVQPLADAAKIVGIQARGWEPRETVFATYEEMCSTYVDAIKQRAAAGPIHLMGWSMGGFIAHDIACRLIAEGRQVPYLIIVDSDDTGEQQHVAQDFEAWADATLRALGDDNSSRPIADRLRALGEANQLPKYVPQTAADLADLERRFHLMHYFPGLLAERAPSGFYPGSTFVVRAADTRARVGDQTRGWGRACGSVETFDVPFDHDRLLDAGPARVIGEAIAAWIERESESRRVSPSEETPR
jgi:thioesterase domain-containing protein